jgi:hypothetical protein
MTGAAKIHSQDKGDNGSRRRFRLRSLSYGGQVVPRNDVAALRYDSALSRRYAPELCMKFVAPENRGRGECRVPAAPEASRAMIESTRVSHHGRTGITRHSRTRVVLTAYFVISPVIGLSCHRRLRFFSQT